MASSTPLLIRWDITNTGTTIYSYITKSTSRTIIFKYNNKMGYYIFLSYYLSNDYYFGAHRSSWPTRGKRQIIIVCCLGKYRNVKIKVNIEGELLMYCCLINIKVFTVSFSDTRIRKERQSIWNDHIWYGYTRYTRFDYILSCYKVISFQGVAKWLLCSIGRGDDW